MKKLNIPINILRRSGRLRGGIELQNHTGQICKKEDTRQHHQDELSDKFRQVQDFIEHPKLKRVKKESNPPILDEPLVLTRLPTPDGFLEVDDRELDLERTLLGGQSFRWIKRKCITDNGDHLIFSGVILNQIIDIWRISSERVAFRRLNKSDTDETKISATKALLEDYFQLKYKLKDLYQEWSSRDEHLAKCCQQYTGFRILRQDPVENVFSFICATNNNIKRISQMVDKLCKKFGQDLTSDISDQTSPTTSHHKSFPTVERLAEDDVFECLRYQLGFGYRAKYIHGTANQIVKLSRENNFKSPRDYLLSLRQLPYKETCKQLMQFNGIGRKVADCICLMSMDHLNSVPTDCHIYEIVCRHYMPNLKQTHKTLTDSVHDSIEDHFRNLHGPLAGWSTSVLFIADLKHLKVSENSERSSNKKAKVS